MDTEFYFICFICYGLQNSKASQFASDDRNYIQGIFKGIFLLQFIQIGADLKQIHCDECK